MVKTINLAGLEETLKEELAQYEDAFTTAGDVMAHALDIFNEPDFDSKKSWKLDCQSENATVHYKDLAAGRYFAAKCKMPISAKDLTSEFWDNLDTHYQWNDNVREAKSVRRLSGHVDYIHYTSNDVLIIKSREIVAARILREINGTTFLATRSIVLPDEIPESRASVRAFLHLSVGRCTPDPEDPEHSCIYDYIICTDLKGMMFKTAVNQVLGRATLKDIENIRRHAKETLRPKLYPSL